MARKPIIAKPDDKVADWHREIEQAEQRASSWESRGDKIVKRYRDERDDSSGRAGPKRMNLLWSNVQTLMPCLYGREPTPIAERRFLDRDVTGRVASQILERALRYEMMDCGFHDAVQQGILDFCLVGRAVAWLRFVPIEGEASSVEPRGDDELAGDDAGRAEPNAGDDTRLSDEETDEPAQDRKLLGASVEVDYVNWKDFLHSKSRTWKEVEWVARRIYMGRQDLVDRFGDKIGNAVPLTSGEDGKDQGRAAAAKTDRSRKAVVYEIWHKPTRTAYFVAKDHDEMLDERPDPLNLEGFWPCPRPLFATLTNDTLIPVPDYAEYQDQAAEVDTLTARIDALVKSLKVAGVYDASVKQLGRLLDEGHENQLIPVATWAAFSEKGGLANAVSFLPIKEIADVLGVLNEAREKAKQDLYEITGLADVIRGQSDPNETATAVRTKGRFGSLRLQARQKEVARFCCDIIRMMGEIVAEHYPVETLIDVSGVMYDDGIGPDLPVPPKAPQMPPQGQVPAPPPAGQPPAPQASAPPQTGLPALAPAVSPAIQQFQQAMAQYDADLQAAMAEKAQQVHAAIDLLRQDKLRGFRIDIETDSTVADDAADEKQSRVEFLGAASAYIEKAMQAGAQYPQMAPLLGKMMLFAIRGYRTGRDLESSFESFIDEMEKDAKAKLNNPQQPPPSPEQIKAEAAQQKAQAEIQAQQIEAQSEAHNSQARMQEKQLDLQVKQFQAQADAQRMAQQAEYDAASHQQRMEELALKQQFDIALQGEKRQNAARSALKPQQGAASRMFKKRSVIKARQGTPSHRMEGSARRA